MIFTKLHVSVKSTREASNMAQNIEFEQSRFRANFRDRRRPFLRHCCMYPKRSHSMQHTYLHTYIHTYRQTNIHDNKVYLSKMGRPSGQWRHYLLGRPDCNWHVMLARIQNLFKVNIWSNNCVRRVRITHPSLRVKRLLRWSTFDFSVGISNVKRICTDRYTGWLHWQMGKLADWQTDRLANCCTGRTWCTGCLAALADRLTELVENTTDRVRYYLMKPKKRLLT